MHSEPPKLSLPRTAAALASALLLGPAAWSQAGFQNQGLPPSAPSAEPPVSSYADSVFGKALAGELTGDLSLDAVVMDDGHPALLITPEVFNTRILGPAVNDMALYRFAGATVDSLLVVDSTGLRRLDYEETETTAEWAATTIDTGWADARVVRTGNVGFTAYADVVGLASTSTNAKQVLVKYGNSSGGFVNANGFTTGGDAYDVVLFDYDGDTSHDLEIAVFTTWGIEVYGPTGTPLDFLAWSGAPLIGAVLDGASYDRLVYIDLVSSDQILGIFDKYGDEGPYDLDDSGIVSAAAGDADGDGDDDLFLGATSDTAFLYLENLTGGATTFDPFNAPWVWFGNQDRDPSGNAAGIAPGDFDGDGDLDVLAPAQGDGTEGGDVHFVRNELIDHRDWVPTLEYSHYVLDENVSPLDGEIALTMALPAEELTPGSGESLWLQCTAWRTDDYYSSSDNEALTYQFLTPVVPGYPDDPYYELSFLTGETTMTFETIHTVVVRQIVATDSEDPFDYENPPEIVAQGPALVLVSAGPASWSDILGQPDVEFSLGRGHIYVQLGQIPDSTTGGGAATGPPPPSLPNEDPPRPRP